jgi:hypothetical protein
MEWEIFKDKHKENFSEDTCLDLSSETCKAKVEQCLQSIKEKKTRTKNLCTSQGSQGQ